MQFHKLNEFIGVTDFLNIPKSVKVISLSHLYT